MVIISPSILASDFSHLADEVSSVYKAGAQWVHIDVMDGHFVPNITLGPDIVKSIRKHSDAFFDVHLMIDDPLYYAKKFKDAGAELITIHLESPCDIRETVKSIKEMGIKVGISIKPNTPAIAVKPYIDDVDLILVMTVEPGFGGQAFMEDMLPKISEIDKMIKLCGREIYLQVDGGIDKNTAKLVYEMGANVLVAGSSIFRTGDYKKAIKDLVDACK